MLELAPVTTLIKGQRLQWVGHIIRRGENKAVRVALKWKLQDKISRGRLRKKWIEVVGEEDPRKP